MNSKDVMKYIESEYSIINTINCEVCGGDFRAVGQGIAFIDNEPYDICECECSSCGHKKTFEFPAPFLIDNFDESKNNSLN